MRNPAIRIVTVLAAAAGLAFTWNLLAEDDVDPAPAAVIGQWQHLAFAHDASKPWNEREIARQINKIGREGWEMVSVLNFTKDGTTNKTIYYFKKPM
jgi:hypothetical protein